MKTVLLLPVLIFGLSLAACAPGATTPAKSVPALSPAPSTASPQPTQPITASPVAPTSAAQTNGGSAAGADLTRVDEQGAVTVQITPLNFDNLGETVNFDVRMNTHSVDLGMNLADLATLTTDNGKKVTAQKWEAPGGDTT
jgi:hypothetical protein